MRLFIYKNEEEICLQRSGMSTQFSVSTRMLNCIRLAVNDFEMQELVLVFKRKLRLTSYVDLDSKPLLMMLRLFEMYFYYYHCQQ